MRECCQLREREHPREPHDILLCRTGSMQISYPILRIGGRNAREIFTFRPVIMHRLTESRKHGIISTAYGALQ